jgi:transcription elongation GreA/GreB family factor
VTSGRTPSTTRPRRSSRTSRAVSSTSTTGSSAPRSSTSRSSPATRWSSGRRWKLLDVESDKEVTYTLVGELEADIKRRLISVTSPLARGLIGKAVGDLATVQSPGGPREYEVVEVLFAELDVAE